MVSQFWTQGNCSFLLSKKACCCDVRAGIPPYVVASSTAASPRKYLRTSKASSGCLVSFRIRKVSASIRELTLPSALAGITPRSHVSPASAMQQVYQLGETLKATFSLAKPLGWNSGAARTGALGAIGVSPHIALCHHSHAWTQLSGIVAVLPSAPANGAAPPR